MGVSRVVLRASVMRSKRGYMWPFNPLKNVLYSPFKGYRLELKSTVNFKDLEQFISTKMRMSHIYQPAMLRVLLENKGTATLECLTSEPQTTLLGSVIPGTRAKY